MLLTSKKQHMFSINKKLWFFSFAFQVGIFHLFALPNWKGFPFWYRSILWTVGSHDTSIVAFGAISVLETHGYVSSNDVTLCNATLTLYDLSINFTVYTFTQTYLQWLAVSTPQKPGVLNLESLNSQVSQLIDSIKSWETGNQKLIHVYIYYTCIIHILYIYTLYQLYQWISWQRFPSIQNPFLKEKNWKCFAQIDARSGIGGLMPMAVGCSRYSIFPLTGEHKPSHHPDSKPENQKHLQPPLAVVWNPVLYYFIAVFFMEYVYISKIDFDIFHQIAKYDLFFFCKMVFHPKLHNNLSNPN